MSKDKYIDNLKKKNQENKLIISNGNLYENNGKKIISSYNKIDDNEYINNLNKLSRNIGYKKPYKFKNSSDLKQNETSIIPMKNKFKIVLFFNTLIDNKTKFGLTKNNSDIEFNSKFKSINYRKNQDDWRQFESNKIGVILGKKNPSNVFDSRPKQVDIFNEKKISMSSFKLLHEKKPLIVNNSISSDFFKFKNKLESHSNNILNFKNKNIKNNSFSLNDRLDNSPVELKFLSIKIENPGSTCLSNKTCYEFQIFNASTSQTDDNEKVKNNKNLFKENEIYNHTSQQKYPKFNKYIKSLKVTKSKQKNTLLNKRIYSSDKSCLNKRKRNEFSIEKNGNKRLYNCNEFKNNSIEILINNLSKISDEIINPMSAMKLKNFKNKFNICKNCSDNSKDNQLNNMKLSDKLNRDNLITSSNSNEATEIKKTIWLKKNKKRSNKKNKTNKTFKKISNREQRKNKDERIKFKKSILSVTDEYSSLEIFNNTQNITKIIVTTETSLNSSQTNDNVCSTLWNFLQLCSIENKRKNRLKSYKISIKIPDLINNFLFNNFTTIKMVNKNKMDLKKINPQDDDDFFQEKNCSSILECPIDMKILKRENNNTLNVLLDKKTSESKIINNSSIDEKKTEIKFINLNNLDNLLENGNLILSKCRDDEHTCDANKCIDKKYMCDNVNHCVDLTDESSCDNKLIIINKSECNWTNEFQCQNGDCIPFNLVCNDKFDCSDGSDESCPNSKGTIIIKINKND